MWPNRASNGSSVTRSGMIRRVKTLKKTNASFPNGIYVTVQVVTAVRTSGKTVVGTVTVNEPTKHGATLFGTTLLLAKIRRQPEKANLGPAKIAY